MQTPLIAILLAVLTAFGAVGGILLFGSWCRGVARTMRQRLGVWRGTPNDYYFRRLDVACRVVSCTHYVCLRQGEIVALQNNLRGFTVGAGPTESLNITIRSRDNLVLTDLPDHDATLWRAKYKKLVSFNEPVKKGTSIPFALEIEAISRTDDPIDRHWLWITEHRVDELTLRVAFVGSIPEKIDLHELDHEGVIHKTESLLIDPVNFEARKVIRWPRPSRVYRIKW